jgi:hypothetical protein
MAQQDYFNNLSRLVAERNARGPEYGLMPIGNPEDARRMEAAMAERNAALTSGTAQSVNDPEFIDSRQPGSNYTANMINYVDPATGQMVARTAGIIPRAGSRFVPVDRFGQTPNQPIPTSGTALPTMGTGGTASFAIGNQFSQPMPQAQQMQNYNNFLQQGIQNSNTMNQGAMTNFANLQPGMQAAQPTPQVRTRQAIPIPTSIAQKIKSPAQNFSTSNTPSARFG